MYVPFKTRVYLSKKLVSHKEHIFMSILSIFWLKKNMLGKYFSPKIIYVGKNIPTREKKGIYCSLQLCNKRESEERFDQ